MLIRKSVELLLLRKQGISILNLVKRIFSIRCSKIIAQGDLLYIRVFLIVFRKKQPYIPITSCWIFKQYHAKNFINNSSISVFTANRWTTYQNLQKQTNAISIPDPYPEVAVFHTLFKSQSSRFHPPLSKIQTREVRNLWKSNKGNSDSLNHRICGRIDSSLVSLLFFPLRAPTSSINVGLITVAWAGQSEIEHVWVFASIYKQFFFEIHWGFSSPCIFSSGFDTCQMFWIFWMGSRNWSGKIGSSRFFDERKNVSS